MSALRPESRARARAVQILYSWELAGGLPVREVALRVARVLGPDPAIEDRAAALAEAVVAELPELDRHVAEAAEHWRLERMAAVDRNILRLGIHELLRGEVPPKVAIDEAVHLAHSFGGSKAPAFINGVLDRVAHALGRL
ncbi:MAG TPA: transcription antitermination factor NusB [Gemmatimonadales bacterium]|jgi:N utilization substance protein B|nr:transcription antitermination factor NusB [Gemmatimonadales bacterium]